MQVLMGYIEKSWTVDNAALFLVSGESGYITGIELVADGRITLRMS